jgi:hypothetical protein
MDARGKDSTQDLIRIHIEMEIYSYPTIGGGIAWGFRIYTDDTKKLLSYDDAGYPTKEAAQNGMDDILKWFADMNNPDLPRMERQKHAPENRGREETGTSGPGSSLRKG